MANKASFLVYTLSVKNIIDFCKKKDANGKWGFEIDLNNAFIYSSVVLSKEYVDDNAYVYQFLKVLFPLYNDDLFNTLFDPDYKYKYENILLNKIVILDFSSVFPGHAEDGKRVLDRGVKIRFSEENEEKVFLAGDKSSSMAKANKIYYLDDKYREIMFERLMLGLDCKKYGIQTIKSKLYAYRGLYLSDSTRINVSFAKEGKGVLLNSNSVIVIRDSKYACVEEDKDAPVITAKPDGKDPDGKQRWKMCLKKESNAYPKEKYHINAFDGEGLICEEYAEEINKQLEIDKGAATSFQIRMPFVKGMLHQVKWMDIIKDLMREKLDKQFGKAESIEIEKKREEEILENLSKIYIQDIFGVERRLSDVKIILTESMFKCKKWFKQYCLNVNQEQTDTITDEMDFYFQQMKEYSHSLYISQTDYTQIKNTGLTVLNYQFINPMELKSETFDKLIASHNSYIQRMIADPVKVMISTNCPKMDSFGEENESSEDEPTLTEEEFTYAMARGKAWLKAVVENEAFLRDDYIKSKLLNYQISLVRDLIRGRILVEGELRYLSGDLLGMVDDIIKSSVLLDQGRRLQLTSLNKLIRNKCLYRDEFFLPCSNLKLKYNSKLAFLRNPHLARYEEYLLQPKRKVRKNETDYYLKFFGHLKGLVMVGRKSMAPIALGGADFDGDIVRVISNKFVVEAIKKGTDTTRNNEETDSHKRGKLKRGVPYISIPSPEANDADIVSKIDPNTIKDTFSNQVGLISNMAVRFGEIEYSGENGVLRQISDIDGIPTVVDLEHNEDSLTANGCITVGLELDANKNGVHPSLKYYRDRNELRKKYKRLHETGEKGTSSEDSEGWFEKDYLYYKKEISGYHMFDSRLFKVNRFSNVVNDNEEVFNYEIEYKNRVYSKSWKKMPIPRFEDMQFKSMISKLPEECIKSYYENINSSEFAKKKREENKGVPLFWFQDKNVKLEYDEELLKQMKTIVKSYKAVREQANKYFMTYERYKDAKYFSRIYAILILQYGKENFEEKSKYVLDAYRIIHEYIYTFNYCSAQEFLRRLIDNKWMWVDKNQRREILSDTILKDASGLTSEVQDLLSNFQCSGYNILYYIAKDVFYADKMSKYEIARDADEPEAINQLDYVCDFQYFNKYMKLLEEELKKRNSAGSIGKKLLSACRKDLCNLFDDDKRLLNYSSYLPFIGQKVYQTIIDESGKQVGFLNRTVEECKVDSAIAYLYKDMKKTGKKYKDCSSENKILTISVDTNHSLFWEMFSWEEIKRNLHDNVQKDGE